MSAEITCDGCGTKVPMEYGNHGYHKPHHWYQRSDESGMQDACSLDCIDDIAAKTGKTNVISPI